MYMYKNMCVCIIYGNRFEKYKNFFYKMKQFFYEVEISIKNMEYSFAEAYNILV